MRSRHLSASAAVVAWLSVVCALSLLQGPWCPSAAAQGRGGGGGRGGERPNTTASASKSELFVVVQVGDRAEVVRKSEVSAFTKRQEEQYRADLKAYEEAKRNAAKEKTPFDQPAPKKPVIKVLPKTFKTEGEAKTFAESVLKKLEDSKAKTGEFVVAEIDGQARVLRKSELDQLKKKLDADYQKAMAEFQEAKKEAAKNKQSFDQPTPKKPSVKLLGPSFKTEAEANAFLERHNTKKGARG